MSLIIRKLWYHWITLWSHWVFPGGWVRKAHTVSVFWESWIYLLTKIRKQAWQFWGQNRKLGSECRDFLQLGKNLAVLSLSAFAAIIGKFSRRYRAKLSCTSLHAAYCWLLSWTFYLSGPEMAMNGWRKFDIWIARNWLFWNDCSTVSCSTICPWNETGKILMVPQ